MTKKPLNHPVEQAFPFLQAAGKSALAELDQYGIRTTVPSGKYIFMEGDTCHHIALVIAGQARVYKMADSGREITLYRLTPGESCILTTSCILGQTSFPAFAVAETDLEVVLIPAIPFRTWVTRYEVWQQYVFGLLSQRLTHMMSVVEEVAFRHIDERLAKFLVDRAHTTRLDTTHAAIAMELGTSREVVSRLLKDLEHEEMISLSRGHIYILKPELLKKKLA